MLDPVSNVTVHMTHPCFHSKTFDKDMQLRRRSTRITQSLPLHIPASKVTRSCGPDKTARRWPTAHRWLTTEIGVVRLCYKTTFATCRCRHILLQGLCSVLSVWLTVWLCIQDQVSSMSTDSVESQVLEVPRVQSLLYAFELTCHLCDPCVMQLQRHIQQLTQKMEEVTASPDSSSAQVRLC